MGSGVVFVPVAGPSLQLMLSANVLDFLTQVNINIAD